MSVNDWPYTAQALGYHDCTSGIGGFDMHERVVYPPRISDADVERIAEAVLQKMLEREQVRAFADAGLTAADVARESSPAELEALRRMA